VGPARGRMLSPMRRLRAAATPIAFYVGLAVFCAALGQLAQWPEVQARAMALDFEPLGPRRHGAGAVELQLMISALVALAGVLAVALRRRALGLVGLVAGSVAGAVSLFVASRTIEHHPRGCLVGPLYTPELFRLGGLFAGVVAMLGVLAWVFIHRADRRAVSPATLGAAAISMVMVLLAALSLTLQSSWPTVLLVPALAGGVALSRSAPLYVSRLVSALVVAAGLLAVLPAIAVIHDARIASHSAVYEKPGLHPRATRTCERPPHGLTVYLWADEVDIRHRRMSLRDPEAARRFLLGSLVELPAINLAVSPEATLEHVATVLRAHRQLGGGPVSFVSWPEREALWSIPAVHVHPCAVPLEVGDDGAPIESFGDWASLLRRADEGPPLRISLN